MFAFSCGQRFFFKTEEGKTFIKIPVYVWTWPQPPQSLSTARTRSHLPDCGLSSPATKHQAPYICALSLQADCLVSQFTRLTYLSPYLCLLTSKIILLFISCVPICSITPSFLQSPARQRDDHHTDKHPEPIPSLDNSPLPLSPINLPCCVTYLCFSM